MTLADTPVAGRVEDLPGSVVGPGSVQKPESMSGWLIQPQHSMKNPTLRPLNEDLYRLYSKLLQALRRASQSEEFLDSIVGMMHAEMLEGKLSGNGSSRIPHFRAGDSSRADSVRMRLAQRAAQGAMVNRVSQLHDGTTVFRINDGSISLPSRLAFLLETLAADDGVSTDHLVAWKTRAFIKERYVKRFGRPLRDGTLNNLLHRLTRRMGGVELVWVFMIQRDSMLGLRFARRK